MKKHTIKKLQVKVASSRDYTNKNNYSGMKRAVKYPKEGGLFKHNRDLYKLPIVLRKYVREWCEVHDITMGIHEKFGDYLIWCEIAEGKEKLIRLYLNYFESKMTGAKYVFAHNRQFSRRINVNNLMSIMNQVDEDLDKVNFEEWLK